MFIASLDKETIIDGTLFYDRKAKKYSVLVDGQDERIKPGGKIDDPMTRRLCDPVTRRPSDSLSFPPADFEDLVGRASKKWKSSIRFAYSMTDPNVVMDRAVDHITRIWEEEDDIVRARKMGELGNVVKREKTVKKKRSATDDKTDGVSKKSKHAAKLPATTLKTPKTLKTDDTSRDFVQPRDAWTDTIARAVADAMKTMTADRKKKDDADIIFGEIFEHISATLPEVIDEALLRSIFTGIYESMPSPIDLGILSGAILIEYIEKTGNAENDTKKKK